eukprot:360315-Chlamydomonas_euryale.AAC.3
MDSSSMPPGAAHTFPPPQSEVVYPFHASTLPPFSLTAAGQRPTPPRPSDTRPPCTSTLPNPLPTCSTESELQAAGSGPPSVSLPPNSTRVRPASDVQPSGSPPR